MRMGEIPRLRLVPQAKSIRARKKRTQGVVFLVVGIPLGICSVLALCMWFFLMNSPDVTPPPDFIMPIANSMGVVAVVFLVLSLFSVGYGIYFLITYKKKA